MKTVFCLSALAFFAIAGCKATKASDIDHRVKGSGEGVIAFYSGRDGNKDIYTMNPDGSSQRRITNSSGHKVFPQWSPDGSMIVYSVNNMRNRIAEIHRMKSDGTDDRVLTNPGGRNEGPAWSPDGKRIVFQSERDGNFEVYRMNADGSNQQRLTNDAAWDGWPCWGKEIPKLTGPYLGQKPPGMTPEIFAPGFICLKDRYELNAEFSPEGDEFYFELSTTTPEEKQKGLYFYVIMVSKRINGVWTKPEMVPFSGKYATMDFCFSPDGKRMYFTSDSPNELESEPKNNIWYVDRIGDGWSEPVILGPPVYKPLVRQGQHSLSADGSLYFRSGDDLFYSKYVSGHFTEPVILPATVNSPYAESKPYVAPDESYLLFFRYDMPDSIDGGRGLYISFKKEDGSWSEAINTYIPGSLPKFSPDGRYFFFSRGGDIYWVDAKIIAGVKLEELNEWRIYNEAKNDKSERENSSNRSAFSDHNACYFNARLCKTNECSRNSNRASQAHRSSCGRHPIFLSVR